MSSNQSIRHFSRIPFNAESSILNMDKDEKWPCTLIDISLHGALISLPTGWLGKSGDLYKLEIQLGDKHEEELCLNMDVKIVHVEHDHVGIEIEQMDVDTASHLHRLVELNEADTNILNRELAELIKQHESS